MKVVPEFKVIEGWEKLPPGYVHKDVTGWRSTPGTTCI